MSTPLHPEFGPVSVSRYEFLELEEHLSAEKLRSQVHESLLQDKVYDVVFHLHHDDGCQELLDDGFCPHCRFIPDMQSTMFISYCPNCNADLRGFSSGSFPCPSCRLMLKK